MLRTVSYLFLPLQLFGLAACARPAAPPPLLLWHTFNPEETEALGAVLTGFGRPVRPVLIPFSRAFNTFRESVATGIVCPDVFRAELSWIPALEAEGLLDRRADGRVALPHSRDGLALLFNRALVPDPPRTLEEFVKVAAIQTQKGRWGFFVRGEAYWFLPFLYGSGGGLFDLESGQVLIDRPEAQKALALYRSLLGFSPPLEAVHDYEDQERLFGEGQIAMIFNGPWAIRELSRRPAFAGHPERLGIVPLWAAPSSGHAYVVPRCTPRKAAAWQLAEALTSRAAEEEMARRAALVPADPDVPAPTADVAAFREALAAGRPQPRHRALMKMWDDFTPAVRAVLRGDAEPDEALAGVARSWRHVLEGTR